MTDREKKIEEIRTALQYRHTSSLYEAEFHANVDEWLRFLLSELERKDRELESQQEQIQVWYNKLCISQEENRKLRDDRDNIAKCADYKTYLKLTKQLQSAQQEREKLIEGLREIANENFLIGSTAIQMKSKARDILIEIGVSVDDPS